MRTLLLIAVLATFASVTTSAEAQWLRSRRSSECANGQCGRNSAAPAAVPEAPASQPAAAEAPSSPAAARSSPGSGSRSAPAAAAAGSAADRADTDGQRQFVRDAVGQRRRRGTPLATHPQPAVKSLISAAVSGA